jgi:hypothetical protein
MSLRTLIPVLVSLAAPFGAFAQADQPPPATSASQSTAPPAAPSPMPQRPTPPNAQSEAGEPRAMTSGADPAPAPEPAQGAPVKDPAGRTSPARLPGSAAPGVHAGTAPGGKSTAADRLELGTATVTGDREQPKVMYIVPWKKSDIGDLSGKPMNSLLDEALAPVDRDEFKRQVMYYQVVKADASQNGAAKAPAQGEK